MLKLPAFGLAAALLAVSALAPAPVHAQALGPDAAKCRAGASGPGVIVNVYGFKQRTGNLRVQLYSGEPADFLASGKWLKRVDLPVSRSGQSMRVCIAPPSTGPFAIAVRHDVDGNGRSGWSDGGGFSRNPRLALPNPRPRHRDVVFTVESGVQTIDVVLNYRQGLSIRPISG